ncbi:amidohydrolase family protein [Shewanella sp. 1_MG-2023]|uniref:amidohydrolase family protein n=1 Tax=unclassified Shewanella TaxID=196818 RepID=UPI000C85B38B|nr:MULTISPECIES: amidohydrolase family protein [unclassified Shewanella]MDO6611750.1 amidohydrolase family protein [Shewanella sp. 7_MG-2023]MDO6771605.1 amidohydrolase family protein [Shewanella sp. 2_MG-2023]MDO6793746.1 amidohydrolase family protein [Shewanella sp. 1_MG-2023]PMG80334.1 amidohydrolase [Shewanella sp. 10N.286.51.B7]
MNQSKLFCTLGMLLYSISLSAVASGYISYDQPKIAITNVNIIDGTGSKIKEAQTVVIEAGKIKTIMASASTTIAEDVTIIDGKGKTLIPGLIMMHEHMFYPTGKAHYTEMLHSFPKLYLAGGATTVRTAGTTSPYGDLNVRDAINSGDTIGPAMDVTAPYLNGPGLPILKLKALRDAENAKAMIDYWVSEGVTSYKAYINIRTKELETVIEQAHLRDHKVTAHLCSITYREAAEMGIDNLEHGFFAATDFVKDKQKDMCPEGAHQSLVDLDIDSPEVNDLIAYLVEKKVAITSTLTIYETFTKGRPQAYPLALEALIPQVREQYQNRWLTISQQEDATWPVVFNKMMQLEKKFVAAGGLLMAGTDPTGYGGVVAGFSNQRMIELLYEAGFSVEEVIKIATLNAANYLNKQQTIGSVEVGKNADLVLINGDLSVDISRIQDMPVVFKNGIGYDTKKIVADNKAIVGLH